MLVVAADDDVEPLELQRALARQESQMQHAAHASTADELRSQLQHQQEAMAAALLAKLQEQDQFSAKCQQEVLLKEQPAAYFKLNGRFFATFSQTPVYFEGFWLKRVAV